MLAFNGFLDGETLRITQSIDDGHVVIDNNGASGEFRVSDESGTQVFDQAVNLIVNMLGSNNDLTLDFDQSVEGFARIQKVGGNIQLTGDSNQIGSDMFLFGGGEDQAVDLAVNSDLYVGGNLSIGLGRGYDSIRVNSNSLHVGKNLRLDRINEFINDGTVHINNGLTSNYYDEASDVLFENNGSFHIGGNLSFNRLSYESRNQTDRLILNGDTTIGGQTLIDLGNGNDQLVDFEGASVGGRITVIGGSGTDIVRLGMMQTSAAPVVLNLGEGDDSVWLGGEEYDVLRVDFGGGNDRLLDPHEISYNASFRNWNGTHRIFRPASKQLSILQSQPQAQIVIDNRGIDESIRVTVDGITTSTVCAENLRVSMQANSRSDLIFDFATPVKGSLIVNANDGKRWIVFDGPVNSFGQLVRVNSAIGEQQVVLSPNAGNMEAKTIHIDLGRGFDQIVTNSRGLLATHKINLKAFNEFTNSGNIISEGDLVIDQVGDSVDSIFRNLGTLQISGDFSYLGSRWADRVVLLGDELISGSAGVDLFNSKSGNQVVRLGDGLKLLGSLKISSNSFSGGLELKTSVGAVVGGDLNITIAGTSRADLSLFGSIGGEMGSIQCSNAPDYLKIALNAPNLFLKVTTGQGNDLVELRKTTLLSELFLDMGEGTDSLIDFFGGQYPFPVTVVNL